MRIRTIVICAFCLVLPVGCGKDVKLYEVTGTATYSGKPIRNLLVNFSDESGVKGGGLTDNEGRLTLLHVSGRQGIEAGTYRVWVSVPNAPKENSEGKKLAKAKVDRELASLFQKYGSATQTPKTVEIKDKQEIQIVFD
jgi:hypothetical protein